MANSNKRNNTTQSTKQDTLLCVGGCGKQKSIKTNYYKSTRKEYEDFNGYCNICKSCLSLMLLDLSTNNVTTENFKKVCAYIDKPFIMLLYNEIVMNDKFTYKNIIGEYISRINLKKEWKNLKYSDSIMFELQEDEFLREKFKVSDDIKRFWGRGLPDEDYIDLQDMFDNLTSSEENMDYKKESDYKTLCIYELQKSKIQYDLSRIKDVTPLQKMIDDISSNLGIKAIQKKDGFDGNKFTLGLITRFAEDIVQSPIKRWVEDLGNVDLMKNICEVHYTGNIANVFGVSNDRIIEYQKELDKYSVHFDKEVIEDGEETE